jgi:hypothetical protein
LRVLARRIEPLDADAERLRRQIEAVDAAAPTRSPAVTPLRRDGLRAEREKLSVGSALPPPPPEPQQHGHQERQLRADAAAPKGGEEVDGVDSLLSVRLTQCGSPVPSPRQSILPSSSRPRRGAVGLPVGS